MAHVNSFTPDKLGSAELVEEVSIDDTEHKVVKVTGVPNPGRTMSILIRGSNRMVLDEADRSLHDALCVLRSLVKQRFLIPGGGCAETEVRRTLVRTHAHVLLYLRARARVCVRSLTARDCLIPGVLILARACVCVLLLRAIARLTSSAAAGVAFVSGLPFVIICPFF